MQVVCGNIRCTSFAFFPGCFQRTIREICPFTIAVFAACAFSDNAVDLVTVYFFKITYKFFHISIVFTVIKASFCLLICKILFMTYRTNIFFYFHTFSAILSLLAGTVHFPS